MKLTPIAANQTELEISNGVKVFFSYKTPVAAYIPGQGYIRTNRKWSRTTTRHINQWLVCLRSTEVDQSVFDNLVGGI